MFKMILHNRIFLIIVIMFSGILFFSRCMQKEGETNTTAPKSRYQEYAGSNACRDCHKDIFDSHLSTAHHLTSSAASLQTVSGSFDSGKNTFYFNPQLYIAVERTDTGLFQTAFQKNERKISRPFDYVVGSGKRGQTFMYWHDQYLFQLPLTWFTATQEWTNSPGYSNKVQFNRPITARCLECHATYLTEQTKKDDKADVFLKSEMILGVECEKCHGPAAAHVKWQKENPLEKRAMYIVNTAKLSREQNLDLCGLCHGGRLTKSEPSFSFKAGDRLSRFFNIDSSNKNISEIDVHGNQFGMMSASMCFKGSAMTCTTCHDSHANQAGKKEIFTQRCLSCHIQEHNNFCKLAAKEDTSFLKSNCIDCHMPEQSSKAIMVLRQGESVPTSAVMRSHYITIYPAETQKILSNKKKK